MIYRLRIKDFAIIDTIDIQLSSGFNALTGETGAGKSIIIDALGLLLGERASQEFIRTGKNTSLVEGEFDISNNKSVAAILENHGWQVSEELIIGRELSRSGKSHAFLNGRMVPVSFLQKIGTHLVDIHGQHDHQSLFSSHVQREFLDQYGKHGSLLSKVSDAYAQYRDLELEIRNVEKTSIERARQIDLLQYQLTEIDQAKIADPSEYENLLQEKNRLLHAEKLANVSQHAYHEMFEDENSIFDRMSTIRTQLEELIPFDADLGTWVSKLEEVSLQFQEIAESCRDYYQGIEYDPGRLDSLESRLETLHILQRKYGPKLEDVLTFFESATKELDRLKSREKDSHDLQNRLSIVEKKLVDLSSRLSEKRKQIATDLETRVISLLKKLGMPKIRFAVTFSADPVETRTSDGYISDRYTTNGSDSFEFLISPNPDEDLKPLNKIASGGEISRIMLALKNLIAAHDRIPSMVFDEIDQGIGGPTAEVVGQVMKSVANHRQILCVTHLAQIAFQADNHLFVQKSTRNKKTLVTVKDLRDSERVEELARMMGGIKSSEEIRRYAKQMLHESRKKK